MKKILVVDDSQAIREVIGFALKKAGYEVESAEDGAQALDAINASTPDMIISDVNMPKVSGLEMLKTIKSNEKFKYIPILMLTTESSSAMKQQGKQLGAKAWLVKPFQPDTLLSAVSKLI